ncbi:MAG: DUF5716 family protein [Treponema sp.]|jgi:hypothetical protein|nr:DUF5716 family protein [Treponema sp.]
MPAGLGVFSVLPENFFSPLARVNRQHYAALLVLYYRLFQENTRGLERELVIREFMAYLALHRDTLAEEADDAGEEGSGGLSAETSLWNSPPGAGMEEEPGSREFDFGGDEKPAFPEDEQRTGNNGASGGPAQEGRRIPDEREMANRFLRRLIGSGWLGEETLADFSRVINITPWGKPFFESLVRVDEGLKTEYESHVVNVYSSLCGETIKENGHFMVLNAREEARALIDSLKVLSQSIKGHYDKLNAEAVRSKASEVLHEHYDLYAGEVLDKAYKRLKTSDNVSRYRQSIFRQVNVLLRDEAWLNESAGKYMRILQTSRTDCRNRLMSMLEDIRDDLRSVDPLEDEIDRRNADYSRASTEIIKAYIEPDSTVAGKLGILIKELYGGNGELRERLAHGLYRISFLSPSTLSLRRQRDEGDFQAQVSRADMEALSGIEAEFFARMRRRLSLKSIRKWLDEQGGRERQVLLPAELIKDEETFIRFVYALLYGDSRASFDYAVEEDSPEERSTAAAGYVIPDIRFRRKKAKHESGY